MRTTGLTMATALALVVLAGCHKAGTPAGGGTTGNTSTDSGVGAATSAASVTAPNPAAGGKSADLDGFVKRIERKLMRADSDKDGRVSKAEWEAARGADKIKRFTRMDADGDGFVTTAEVDAYARKSFAKKDRNHDGVLSADEHGKKGDGGKAHGGKNGGKNKSGAMSSTDADSDDDTVM